jgi:hypothetical protein
MSSIPRNLSGNPTTNTWSLREETLLVAHRWPIIVLCCLGGALLGWIVSLFWPSPYRATKELFVGLNIYPSEEYRYVADFAGLQFGNTNDYKNWQMANLNSLIYMDEIIDETLARLQRTDLYWKDVSRDELVGMLHAYWRNAGKWRLVAEMNDAEHASQAVSVWHDVVISRVHKAVLASRDVMALDLQLKSTVSAHTQALARQSALIQNRDSLEALRKEIIQNPEAPVEDADRWLMLYLIADARFAPALKQLEANFPPSGAGVDQHLDWIDQALRSLDQEIQVSGSQAEEFEKRMAQMQTRYSEASQDSLGLSANLQVDKITDDLPRSSIVRPTSLFILIGGLLGLIAGVALWLVRISLHAEK